MSNGNNSTYDMVHKYVQDHSDEYNEQISKVLGLLADDIKQGKPPLNVFTLFLYGFPIVSFTCPSDDEHTYLRTIFKAVALSSVVTGLKEYSIVLNPVSETRDVANSLLCISSCEIGIMVEHTFYKHNPGEDTVTWRVEPPDKNLYNEIVTNTYHAYMSVLPFGHYIHTAPHGSHVLKLLEAQTTELGLEMHPHNVELLDMPDNSLVFAKVIAEKRSKLAKKTEVPATQ